MQHTLVYKPSCLCSSSYATQNVEKKIQLLKDLQHEHIVQYYGSERSDNHISIFMECMLGVSV